MSIEAEPARGFRGSDVAFAQPFRETRLGLLRHAVRAPDGADRVKMLPSDRVSERANPGRREATGVHVVGGRSLGRGDRLRAPLEPPRRDEAVGFPSMQPIRDRTGWPSPAPAKGFLTWDGLSEGEHGHEIGLGLFT